MCRSWRKIGRGVEDGVAVDEDREVELGTSEEEEEDGELECGGLVASGGWREGRT